jgi:exoribonuclease R
VWRLDAQDADEQIGAGSQTLQRELGVSPQFPPEVLTEAEQAAASPLLPQLDRTDLPLVTIDPPGARDLDQALHVERAGDGYAVHYAIADVAAFVRAGGAIDLEARRRGETLYGVGDKVPLHPPVISEQACSLLPDGPRPALLWTIGVDGGGEGTSVRVERAMVRSRAQLTYQEVQTQLDEGRADASLQLLREVGLLRQQREVQRGGVSLPLPDQEVACREGRWHLEFREQVPVEAWNAQISLLTGMAAAHLMTEAKHGVLRTLRPADPEDVSRLQRVARALEVPWPEAMTYPDFIRSLDPARAADAAVLTASTALLRGSGYVAFDGAMPDEHEHSALASTYSHVTAPLRRLVDRFAGEACVALSAGQEVPAWVTDALPDLPGLMRESARRAGTYERGLLDLVEAVLLQHRVGETFEAMVVSRGAKRPHEGQIMVKDPAVEAPVETADGGPLPLGTEVQVRLDVADPVTREVRFTLASAAAGTQR